MMYGILKYVKPFNYMLTINR